MVRPIHFIFIGFFVAVSFVSFRSIDGTAKPVQWAAQSPSMIPGAEAVRPLAANQSGRITDLASQLKSPAQADPE